MTTKEIPEPDASPGATGPASGDARDTGETEAADAQAVSASASRAADRPNGSASE